MSDADSQSEDDYMETYDRLRARNSPPHSIPPLPLFPTQPN